MWCVCVCVLLPACGWVHGPVESDVPVLPIRSYCVCVRACVCCVRVCVCVQSSMV